MAKISKKIYLDYAATTPVDKEVLKAMAPYFSLKFGNPSSIHSFGQEAIAAIDSARETFARFLKCSFEEIIFTGSATEANNLAIKGLIKTCDKRHVTNDKKHIITTAIEHESVHEPLKELKKEGHDITFLPVNKDGFIKISDLEKAIKDNTVLVSVIYANNEIGTIQPVKEIGKLIEKINVKRKVAGLGRIYFHIDAAQALNYLECRPDWLKADLMTFSGHKIYGPKGVGALYVRKGTPLKPLIFGGNQEFGLRSGTENVANIAGFAKALEMALKNQPARFKKVKQLQSKLLDYIIKNVKNVKLNGSRENRLPNNLNFRFPGIDNETLLVALDRNGIAVSAGAACSARASKASHILTALGLKEKEAKESIRITLGKDTAEKDVKRAAKIIIRVIKQLISDN